MDFWARYRDYLHDQETKNKNRKRRRGLLGGAGKKPRRSFDSDDSEEEKSQEEPEKESEEEKEEDDHKKGSILSIRKLKTDTTSFPQPLAVKKGWIPEFPSTWLFVGHTGTGKTNAAHNLLMNKYMFGDYFESKNMYAFGRTVKSDGLWKQLHVPKENLFVENLKEEVKDVVTSQEEKCRSNFHTAPSILLFFEDVTSENTLMKSESFLVAFCAARHNRIMTIANAHKWKALNRTCRLQAHCICFFGASQSEVNSFAEDWCPAHMHKKDFMNLINWATKKTKDNQHPFLFVNAREHDLSKRFRRNLDEFIDLSQLTAEVIRDPGITVGAAGGAGAARATGAAGVARATGAGASTVPR